MRAGMFRILFFCMLLFVAVPAAAPEAHNPFTSKPEKQHMAPAPPFKSRIFVEIIVRQQMLRQRMSNLVREVKSTGRVGPLLMVAALAFCYGALHSAGPGHGKFVALSYVLAHKATVGRAVMFGTGIGLFHGMSGVVGVVGLHALISKGINETLGTVTTVTQVVGFGMITLLGAVLLVKNGADLFLRWNASEEKRAVGCGPGGREFGAWVVSLGMVPCPAVVMVMLFCLSMDAFYLGLLLCLSISLGMAATLSLVAVAGVMGRGGLFKAVKPAHAGRLQGVMGVLSGLLVTLFGGFFLLASIP